MANVKTIDDHRADLAIAREAYARSKNYWNYIAIQKAQQGIDNIARLNRYSFLVIQGGRDWQ